MRLLRPCLLRAYDGSFFHQTLYAYTPATDTWSSALGDMNTFRDGDGGGFVGNMLYAIGGRNASDTGAPFGLAVNESYLIGFSPIAQNFTKIQLNYNQMSPSGSVRLDVYSDNGASGPGTLLLDAGAVTITNGWTVISGLKLSLTPGTRYWLVFVQNSNMAVSYTVGMPVNPSGIHAHCFNSLTYGVLPSSFPTSGMNCTSANSVYAEKLTVQ